MEIELNQEQNQIIQNAIEVFYPQYKNLSKIFEKSPNLQNFKDNIKTLADTLAPVKFYIQDCIEEDLIISNNEISFLTDVHNPWIVYEIFQQELYKFDEALLTKEKYTVFDIGANRGYTALYFAQKYWCEYVYGYELMPETYKYALKSIELNTKLKNKIKLLNFGLGKFNKTISGYHIPYLDGISSIDKDFLISFVASTYPEAIDSVMETPCEIKKASEVSKEIIEENNISNIIFKIDVEGAEYDIIDDLSENYPEVFDKIEIIIGEAHNGHLAMAKLSKTFAKFGFYLHSFEDYCKDTIQFLYVKF
jgi:FkbM family methyltransferase